MRHLQALLAVAAFFTTLTAAAADTLPRIDLEKLCRSRAQAVGQIGDSSAQNLFDACRKGEQDAQAALTAAWKDIPASYKERCIKGESYAASYVEWISCLELLIDVKSLR